MIVGIDFDNTIASYDELMHRIGVARGLIPADLPRNKKMIRDAIRALPDGESKWRALQTYSYGPGMRDAHAMEGVKQFIASCKARDIPVRIVSHKTEFANYGDPTVNLRKAAIDWMEREGLLGSGPHAVAREHVFFEDSRERKIGRIRALGVTHFVDDLEETFLDATFPAAVRRILFAPRQPSGRAELWTTVATWSEIHQQLLAA